MIVANFTQINGSRDPAHGPFRGGLSSLS